MRGRITLTFLLAACSQSAIAATMPLNFGSTFIRASNIAPGSRVYAYSEALEARGYYSDHVERDAMLQESGGIVIWDIGTKIPLRSVWLVVNMTTGDYAVSPAPEFNATGSPLAAGNLPESNDGALRTVRYEGTLVWFVIVRPHVGAWRFFAFDGGSLDSDGVEDGYVTVGLNAFRPGAETTSFAPSLLRPGDIVFAYNAFRQRYIVGAIPGGTDIPVLSNTYLLGLTLVLGVLGMLAIRSG